MAWREALKAPIAKPTAPKPKFDTKDDDWETDVKYEVKSFEFLLDEPNRSLCAFLSKNASTEKSQRFGSTSVPGTGRVDHVDFKSIQEKIKTADQTVKQVYQDTNPNRGYGGKYGTDKVMDKVTVIG